MVRGFKARAERISARYRKILGVSLVEALPYRQLAELLDVLIWTPVEIPGLSQSHIDQLTGSGSDEWSAVTIVESDKKLIVVNSTHSEKRLANDITHELAHLILDHQKARLEVSEGGHMWLKTYEKDQEDEADWLAASLLIPRVGLLSLCGQSLAPSTISSRYGVSSQLVNMRINLTGIKKQLGR